MVGTLAAFTDKSKIERRALKISDPIERLRYLRQHATTPTPSSFGWRWIAYLVFVMGVVPMGSDALNREPLNRASFNRATLTSMPANSAPAPVAVPQQVSEIPNVWPVDQTSEYDLYSNGLRIENKLEISNQPRSYSLIERASAALGPLRSQPAGIVFHTTEGDQVKFEPDQKTALKRIGQNLLLFIRNKRAYHFVIDRFGRVHRIVVESDAANHAGHSVWADSQWSYVDLNASFLGVAFEARMQDEQPINEAQLHSARSLTEMLRAKYNLPAGNCVTHAQVSVNPENMRSAGARIGEASFRSRSLDFPTTTRRLIRAFICS